MDLPSNQKQSRVERPLAPTLLEVITVTDHNRMILDIIDVLEKNTQFIGRFDRWLSPKASNIIGFIFALIGFIAFLWVIQEFIKDIFKKREIDYKEYDKKYWDRWFM